MKHRAGVLVLQGDFAEHIRVLEACHYEWTSVRTVDKLDACDSLIIPGGESTTILKLMDRIGLRDPLTRRIENGLPVFGTCAGTIVLSKESGRGEKPLELMDISVERNAYGPQVESFEAELDVPSLSATVMGVFIRAPAITAVGPEVEVLASYADQPALVRQGKILCSTFHPELAGETRIHRYFIEEVAA